MNLAFIGFFVAGAVFAIYAYTFYILAEKKLPVFLKNYAYAYFSLASTFLIWAFASVYNSFLNESIILGNSLLLLGSLFLVAVLFNNKDRNIKILVLSLGTILSIVFIYMRLNYYPPTPFMLDGILIFNTPKIIAGILGLVFVSIWFPANLLVAKTITSNMTIKNMYFTYSSIYALSTIATILFIAFQSAQMVIFSFVILSMCFVMLIYSNYIISKLLPSRS